MAGGVRDNGLASCLRTALYTGTRGDSPFEPGNARDGSNGTVTLRPHRRTAGHFPKPDSLVATADAALQKHFAYAAGGLGGGGGPSCGPPGPPPCPPPG